MHIKKLVLGSTLALSLLSTSMVFANEDTNKMTPQIAKHHHFHKGSGILLTTEQRADLQVILQDMRQQMTPLLKEKRALKLQLMGKLATPAMQWNDIAKLVEHINENNAQITTLFAKTQLTTYQKLGVLLPAFHGRHGHGHHGNHLNG